jgi:hypothetical protein
VKFSVRQILASAGGAVIAALIASAFGVKGTIVGVAVGAAAATLGTALVAQSIERGHEAVKQAVERAPDSSSLLRRLGGTAATGAPTSSAPPPSSPASPASSVKSGVRAGETQRMESAAAPAETTRRLEISAVADAPAPERLQASTMPGPTRSPSSNRFSWRTIAGTAAIVFVLALLFITAVELIAGKPLSSIFGDNGTGTSVNNIISPSSPSTSTTTTTPTTTSTSTPSESSTTTTSPSGTSTTSTTVPPTTTTTTREGGTTTTTTGAGGSANGG